MINKYRYDSKYGKILYWSSVIVLSIIFTFVYYGLQSGTYYSHEEYLPFFSINRNIDHLPSQLKKYVFAWFCIKLFGYDIFAVRVYYCIWYFLVCVFAFDLCVRDTVNKIKIVNMWAYILFMVMMHKVGIYSSEFYGDASFGTGLYTHYPFSIHIISTFFCVFSLWIIKNLPNKMSFCIKTIIILLIVSINSFVLYRLNIAELMFYIVCFAFPVFLILIISQNKTIKGKLICSCLLCVLSLVLLFVLPEFNSGTILDRLNHVSLRQAELFKHLAYYWRCLLVNYNIDFRLTVTYRLLEYLSFFLRFVCLLLIFSYIIYSVIRFFVDDIDLFIGVAVMSFLTLSVVFVLTNWAFYDRCRYLNLLIPYGTILLSCFCNHIHNIRIRVIVAIFLFVGCFSSYSSDWNRQVDPDMKIEEIVEYLDENDARHILSDIKLGTRIAICSQYKNVDIMKYEVETQSFSYEQNGDYMYDVILFPDYKYASPHYELEDIIRCFGVPYKCIKRDGYCLLVYNPLKEGKYGISETIGSEYVNSYGEYNIYNKDYLESFGKFFERLDRGTILHKKAYQTFYSIPLEEAYYSIRIKIDANTPEDYSIVIRDEKGNGIPIEYTGNDERKKEIEYRFLLNSPGRVHVRLQSNTDLTVLSYDIERSE